MREWLFIMGLFIYTAASAQGEPSSSPSSIQLEDDGGAARVYCADSSSRVGKKIVGLDDQLSIRVQNLDKLLQETKKSCSDIVLFIDGFALKGLQPTACNQVLGHVHYRLLRKEEAKDVWSLLLGSPNAYLRPVSISVGLSESVPLISSVPLQLEVIPRAKLFLFLVLSVGSGLACLWLCRQRGMIRTGSPTVPIMRRPYNLALFQMGFWFFLVLVAYLFIWMVNDEFDEISDSALALLGICSATALGASLIDKNKQPDDGLATPPEPGKPAETRGFLDDLLTDEGGSYSLYRFQLFVWTLVLGTIFCNSVYRSLAMPRFSPELLGLMGLSSGTFLGFRVPEGTKKTAEATSPATGPTSK